MSQWETPNWDCKVVQQLINIDNPTYITTSFINSPEGFYSKGNIVLRNTTRNWM